MKPTDEAKRLREDINQYYTELYGSCEDHDMEFIDFAINKVLDAANTAIEYADDDDYSDWKDIAKSEINKLRP